MDKPNRKPFSVEEDNVLCELWEKNWTLAEISKVMLRSRGSIHGRMRHWVDRGRLEPHRQNNHSILKSIEPKKPAAEVKMEGNVAVNFSDKAKALHEKGVPLWKIGSLLSLSPIQVSVITGSDLPKGPHLDLLEANVAHLIDLKRAGHSPSATEYNVPAEDQVRHFCAADRIASYMGSSAAMCADNV